MPVLLSAWLPLSKLYGFREQPARGMPIAPIMHHLLLLYFSHQDICCGVKRLSTSFRLMSVGWDKPMEV